MSTPHLREFVTRCKTHRSSLYQARESQNRAEAEAKKYVEECVALKADIATALKTEKQLQGKAKRAKSRYNDEMHRKAELEDKLAELRHIQHKLKTQVKLADQEYSKARARFEGSYAAHQQEEKEVLELSKELHALNKSKLLYHQKWIHSLEGIDQYNQTLYSLQNDMKGMKDAINNTVNQARTVTAAKPAEIKFEW